MIDRLFRGSALRLATAAVAASLAAWAHAADIQVSGSVYVDYWGINNRTVGPQQPEGITPEAALTIGKDIHDELSFSVKACFSCHGIEIEHFQVDYQPKNWFNVQAGRIAVPFGDYSQRVDGSGHKTVSAPLIYDMGRMAYGSRTFFNEGVLPLPYVDTGVLVYGQTWLGSRLQLWYGAYAVAGLRGSNDLDFIASRSIYYTDNNNVPAGGGRATLTYSSDPGSFFGDISIGASGSAARYDQAKKLDYRMWGADASLRLWKVTVRGEYATRRTDIDPNQPGYVYAIVDPWFEKSGWYAELEHPILRWMSAVYRYDVLERRGVPLPGADAQLTTKSTIDRYTVGLVLTPAAALYVKLSWEYWKPTDFPVLNTGHIGVGGAF